jgi:hypothetical protein
MYQQQGHLIGHDNRTERDKYIMEWNKHKYSYANNKL